MTCFVFDSLKETDVEPREMLALQTISQPGHLGTRWKLELGARRVMKRETLFVQEKKNDSKGISALLQEVDFESNLRLKMKNFRQRQPLHIAAQLMRSWKHTFSFFLIFLLGCKLSGSTFMSFLKSVPQTSS